MTDFTLNGQPVTALPGETIWQVARRLGVDIPHLCHRPEPGYRPDGNCRACLVEIKGERTLAASCIRIPIPGMEIRTDSPRVATARRVVMELLAEKRPAPAPDLSHPAMRVDLSGCVTCGLCVRACREVQVNDVLGMAGRGHRSAPVFDLSDPMGHSSCVGCGECVQACPTGALAAKGATPAERSVESLCPYCGVGCALTFHVADNRIVAADGRDGPANQNRLCVKGRFGFDYVHHPHRLTQPLIRREDAPKHAESTVDPGNPWSHFRPASWEEALQRAAEGFLRLRHAHGPAALAGFGSAKCSNEEAYLFQKLIRTGFGTNNVDHCTRLCHASSVAALMETIGSGSVTAPVRECANSDLIIVIGANPTANHPVAASYIKNAVSRGATLVVADPRPQPLMRHAHHRLMFRPGSDVALLNALLHVVIAEKLYDADFVAARTTGFDALAEHVAEFSPERMAAACGIPADELRTVARRYATAGAAMIFWGMGISQHTHGTDNVRCLIALALLCGQVGRPGAGLHPLRGQNNVQGASDAGLIPMIYPDYRSVESAEVRDHFEQLWGTPLDSRRGLTVVEILTAARAGTVKGMYILGENPAMSDPDLAHARAGLAALEHLVVQDIFLTETAFHADVVLPAAAFPEKLGSFTNTDRRVQLARPAVTPPGEARPDWQIITDLANALGLGWSYDAPAAIHEEMRAVMPSLAGIPWTRLEREGGVTHPCPAEDVPGQEILFAERFATTDGRGRLVPAAVLPPDEVPDEAYPMVLTTGRILEHWHTGAMTRRAVTLDTLEPEPACHLSPVVLERLGVAPGGRVRVVTRRGAVEIAARVDAQLAADIVFLPFCFHEAAANLLTNPALDPFGKIPELKYCAARVESAT
jgi:formate dehydrogenase major subunit